VRQGSVGEFDAPEILSGYRSKSAAREPGLDDLIFLPNGSVPWRVVDWALGIRLDSPENVPTVELFGD
jgi:hypothetical protein